MITILPYKLTSDSANKLKDEIEGTTDLEVRIAKKVCPGTKLAVLWGRSKKAEIPESVPVLQSFEGIKKSISKIKTFEALKEAGVPTVPWTVSMGEARNWIEKGPVFARLLTKGSKGKGVVVMESLDAFVEAPLYTGYVKGTEFRVHVFLGCVIHVQEKRRKKNFEGEFSPWIKSHQYGWVFCKENVDAGIEVQSVAVRAIKALGLDFGAVDLIRHGGNAYVLEVNSAPGIEGTTLEKYGAACVFAYESAQSLHQARALS